MNRKAFIKSIFLGMAGIPILNVMPETFDAKQKKVIKILNCYVAGYQFYEGEEIENNIQKDSRLALKHEPENLYDRDAVAVYYKNHKLGFIPRNDNKIIANILKQKIPVSVKVNTININSPVWERLLLEVVMEV